MTQAPHLVLDPKRCDRCGRCIAVCEHNAVKVGRTYLAIDRTRCDGCDACVRTCTRGAIRHPGVPAASRATGGRATAARAAGGRATAPVARQTAAQTPRAKSAAAQSRAPKSGKRGGFQWTLLEAAAMLSVTFSAFVVKEATLASAGIRSLPAEVAIAGQVGVLALYYAAQLLVLGWLVHRRGGELLAAAGMRRTGGGAARAIGSAGLVVAGLLGTRLVASLYVYFTRQVGLMPSAGTGLLTLFGSDYTGLALAVAMVVLVGPVVEEVVFRAALLEGLAARFGAWPAILAQALLFAAFHRSVWLLFPMFVLGATLGWLAHSRGSLWPAIAMHALYNGITVAAAFYVAFSA